MSFLIHGLDPAPFVTLFELGDTELTARHMQRRRVLELNDAPCRVSLADAEPGEEVLLLPYAHHALASPYRNAGPIFVRLGAEQARCEPGEVPDSLRRRLLALRAYDAAGWMLGCDVVQGEQLEPLLERLLAVKDVAFVNLHYARAGCFAARAEAARP